MLKRKTNVSCILSFFLTAVVKTNKKKTKELFGGLFKKYLTKVTVSLYEVNYESLYL